ncbi:Shedu anti-phage system protein SduA domain-containing protein [Pseudomonas aeruginosa]
MAIVEIKTPGSPLLRGKAYRNREVFAPDEDLSGAVSQVLYQQSKIHENWLFHRARPELQDSRPDAIKCVVITGMLPKDEMQRRSFEVFRNACKNVEVITFDELLGKLRLLSEHLTPRATSENELPF